MQSSQKSQAPNTSESVSDEAYTLTQAAAILDCTAETVAERISAGDIPGVKFGRSWIIPRQAFCQRLNEMSLQDAAKRRQNKTVALLPAPHHSLMPQPHKQVQARSGRIARVPPPLPSLPSLVQSAG